MHETNPGNNSPLYQTVGFESVDRYKNPVDFVEYLEVVNALPDIQRYKKRLDELLGLSSRDVILDVGCGTGSDMRDIAKRNTSIRIVGIDISMSMLDRAKTLTSTDLLESGTIAYSKQDANYLGFADNSFNVTRADRTFQHLSTPQKALHEIVRVTKPGGRILLTDSFWDTLHIDGVPEEDSDTMRKAYLTIIKNPSIARSFKTLMELEGIQDVKVEIMKLVFSGFKDAETVLWMEDSLQEGMKMGGITQEEMEHATQSIRTATPEHISASFNFYLAKGIKN